MNRIFTPARRRFFTSLRMSGSIEGCIGNLLCGINALLVGTVMAGVSLAASAASITSSSGFINTAISSQTGTFTASFDATPSISPANDTLSFSNGAQTAYTGLAATVRFNPTGTIDARNGGVYAAASNIPFSAGTSYHFRMVINVSAHSYSAYVTPAGGSEMTIASNYAFRSEQAGIASIDNFNADVNVAPGGSLTYTTPTIASSSSSSSSSLSSSVSSSKPSSSSSSSAVSSTASSSKPSSSSSASSVSGTTVNSSNGFVNSAIANQTGSFTASFDAKPSISPANDALSFSNGAQTAYTGLAATVRFNNAGTIDARNGGAYAATTNVPFAANTNYHFRMVINLAARTYSAYVTPAGGTEQTIATNYAFRTEQAGITSLNNFDANVNATPGGSLTYTLPTISGVSSSQSSASQSSSSRSSSSSSTSSVSSSASSGIPSLAQVNAKEAELTNSPLMRAVQNSIRTLDNTSVTAVVPGRAANPSNVRRVESIVSEAEWNFLFPTRDASYTYVRFLQSVAKFQGLCSDYTDGRDANAICRKSLATMFAHFTQETGGHASGSTTPEWRQGLQYVSEVGCTATGPNCGYNGECSSATWITEAWPCGKNADGSFKKYYGRGAKQLSYNFNYGPFSAAMFGDVHVLLNDPDQVATTWLNLASAAFFFTYPQPPKPSMLHVIDGTWQPNAADKAAGLSAGFGATIMIINGGIECGSGADKPQALNRVAYYRQFANELQVPIPATEQLSCANMQPFNANGAGALLIYWELNWHAGSEYQCQLVSYQTAYSALIPGDYRRCVEKNWNITVQ
jgi:chitodextrinase